MTHEEGGSPVPRSSSLGRRLLHAQPRTRRVTPALDAVLGVAATAQAVAALDDAWLSALASLPVGILVIDAGGRPRFANSRAAELLGVTAAQPLGEAPPAAAEPQQLHDAVAAALDRLPTIRRPIVEALQGRPAVVEEVEVPGPAGPHALQVNAAPVRDVAGAVRLALVSFIDRAGVEAHVARLAVAERRYRLLFERNLAGVCRSTLGGRILAVNDSMVRLFGYDSVDEMLDLDARDLYPEGDRRRHLRNLRRQRNLSSLEVRLRRKDGTFFWGLLSSTLIDDGEAGEPIVEATVIDITDRRQSEELSAWRATHDALTGLPNRVLFDDRLAVALAHARRNDTTLAVGFLDLDGFKGINDRCGHEVGDRLLVAVAERLCGLLRASDTLARWGGDELVVLLPGVKPGAALEMAAKMMALVAAPFSCLPAGERMTASVGLALYPDDGLDASALLRCADEAMYRVKEEHHRLGAPGSPPEAS